MNATRRGWRFATRSNSDVEHDPTEADQFNSEDVGQEQSLIREATQNSQDAKQGGSPVVVRLAHVLRAYMDDALLDELTAGLPERLEASHFTTPANKAASALVVEDFGAKGLTGSWSDGEDEGPFRSFWFRHGRSFKQGTVGGRWGLGKLVFPMMSAYRCHFGLTVRDPIEGGLLLGQAVLKTHSLGGFKYAPHGHWGDLVGDDVQPVRDADFLKRFSQGFGLKRGDAPGLSVVIPSPHGAFERDKLIEYVVSNYAFPILTGRLEFDVLGERVDENSVRALGKELLPPGLIDFIDEVRAAAASVVLLPEPHREVQTFAVREQDFEPEQLSKLRARYAANEHVALRLPLSLKKREEPEGTSYVDIHLKAAATGQQGAALCVRGDITVPNVAKSFRAETHFALLEAGHPLVSEFLGDAENPAHTDWSANAERFRANWASYPGPKLKLIRGSVAAMHKLLATGAPQTDANALLEFFSLPDSAEGRGGSIRPKPRRGRIDVRPPDPPPPGERLLNITQVAGGFTIRPGPGFARKPKPQRLSVEMAYDADGADAFKMWSPLDFNLGGDDEDLAVEVEGASCVAEGRRADLRIGGPDFRFNVTGFDPRRDLVIKWSWRKPEGRDEEALQ